MRSLETPRVGVRIRRCRQGLRPPVFSHPLLLADKDFVSALRGSGWWPLGPSYLRHHCSFTEQLQHQTLDHMRKPRDNAFDGNNMHFLNEIDLAAAEGLDASGDLFVFLVSATF